MNGLVLELVSCWSSPILAFRRSRSMRTDRSRRLVEFTDGRVEELPMPTIAHHAILSFLNDLFKTYLKPRGGFVLFAGLRVRICEGKYREPDLAALRDRSHPRN